MNIKLKAKLSAYSKGVLPTLDKFVRQAPDDSKLYGRKTVDGVGEWEEIVDKFEISYAGEGISINKDGRDILISARQKTLYDLPTTFEDDTTYFIINDNGIRED